MPRTFQNALLEILDEIDWLTNILAQKSLADFKADRALRYAVERSIEIISEASRRIPDSLKSLHPEA